MKTFIFLLVVLSSVKHSRSTLRLTNLEELLKGVGIKYVPPPPGQRTTLRPTTALSPDSTTMAPSPDPGPDPGPDPVLDPSPGPDPSPDAGLDPSPGPDSSPNPGPDPGPVPGLDPSPGPDPDLDPSLGSDSGSAPGSGTAPTTITTTNTNTNTTHTATMTDPGLVETEDSRCYQGSLTNQVVREGLKKHIFLSIFCG